ncbi:unknown [[Mannheimia] succiniciproducens MBEL55E]|uniref:Uncharacterized protein n=1 Tax=Mannheimia succiniciproducens (strain KCTC 0769BP / MBEL55E) TaxID=221988 RepID=Q65SH1_MANSM|nr:unknown [[Mannheimia] succiniciproducens MBEL55E]
MENVVSQIIAQYANVCILIFVRIFSVNSQQIKVRSNFVYFYRVA